MGIRTGEEYLAGLRDDRDVWIGGERVADVTAHPGIRRAAETLAGFLDKQHDPAMQDKLTYQDDDGERIAMSFLIPKSSDDVRRRGAAFYEWASWSAGMFGRTPDYKNASIMSFAAASDFLDNQSGNGQTDFADNELRLQGVRRPLGHHQEGNRDPRRNTLRPASSRVVGESDRAAGRPREDH